MKIEHIGIYAHDTVALADWYVDTLNLRVVQRLDKAGRPPIFFLEGDEGRVIELLPTDELHANRALNAPGFSHIGLVVPDFDAAEKHLERKGVRLHGARDTSNGWRIAYFEDPEGNTLEIVHRPQ